MISLNFFSCLKISLLSSSWNCYGTETTIKLKLRNFSICGSRLARIFGGGDIMTRSEGTGCKRVGGRKLVISLIFLNNSVLDTSRLYIRGLKYVSFSKSLSSLKVRRIQEVYFRKSMDLSNCKQKFILVLIKYN